MVTKVLNIFKKKNFRFFWAEFVDETDDVEKNQPPLVVKPFLLAGDGEWLARKSAGQNVHCPNRPQQP